LNKERHVSIWELKKEVSAQEDKGEIEKYLSRFKNLM
jgi:hypothetical protein